MLSPTRRRGLLSFRDSNCFGVNGSECQRWMLRRIWCPRRRTAAACIGDKEGRDKEGRDKESRDKESRRRVNSAPAMDSTNGEAAEITPCRRRLAWGQL